MIAYHNLYHISSKLSLKFLKFCSFSLIAIVKDRAFLDPLNSFLNGNEGHEKPLARHSRPPETIHDLDLKPSRLEDAVDQVF